MNPDRLFQLFSRGLLAAAMLGASAAVHAAAEPPARGARLEHVEGAVVLAPAGDEEWVSVRPERRLARNDRLWTDDGARAELRLRPGTLRIDGQTQLTLMRLEDRATRVKIGRGTMRARLRDLPAGDDFQVHTPQLVLRALQPGDYRVDVDPAGGTTLVAVLAGAAMLHGDGGKTLELRPGQRLRFSGSVLEQVPMPGLAFTDGFDRWALARDRQQQGTARAETGIAKSDTVRPESVQRPESVPRPEPARQPAVARQTAPSPDTTTTTATRPPQRPRPADNELAQRESWQREQQANSEKWRREHETYTGRQQNPQGPQSTAMGGSGSGELGSGVPQTGVPVLRQGFPILRELRQ